MKKIYLLLCFISLTACNTNSLSSSTSSWISSNSETTISVESGYEYSYDFSYNVLSCFTSIMNEIPLAVGNDYKLDFDFKTANTAEAIVESSHTDVLTVKKETDHFVIECRKAGDSILVIKDETGLIHFRYVVHVKDKLTKESAAELLISVDYWQSIAPAWSGGNFEMIFVDEQTFYFNSVSLTNNEILSQYKVTFQFESINKESITYRVTEIDPISNELRLKLFDLDITGVEIR